MKKGILSTIIEEIGEQNEDDITDSYVMINVRPGDKIASMFDILAKLSKKSPSSLVSDEISIQLAKYATSSPLNAEAILNATEETLQKNGGQLQADSALDILQKGGTLKIEQS